MSRNDHLSDKSAQAVEEEDERVEKSGILQPDHVSHDTNCQKWGDLRWTLSTML